MERGRKSEKKRKETFVSTALDAYLFFFLGIFTTVSAILPCCTFPRPAAAATPALKRPNYCYIEKKEHVKNVSRCPKTTVKKRKC